MNLKNNKHFSINIMESQYKSQIQNSPYYTNSNLKVGLVYIRTIRRCP